MVNDAPTPPLGLRDAEQIVRRLAPALHEHGAWIQRIHSILVCRIEPEPDDVSPNRHLRSGLGRWLSEENSEYIRRHPEYAAAIEHHCRAHELARSLCETVRAKERITPDDYAAFIAAVGRLDKSVETLVQELWELLRYTDPLTGIATRYAMLPRLDEERVRARRTGNVCSLCMVDLDRFKAINDAHGHQAGDRVLEAVSDYLVRNLRTHDQVCRYGGEEFVLMLPNTPPASAVPVVDRLRRGLAELPVELPDGVVTHVTASFGIAPLAPDQAVRDSIDHADAAMYAAKRAGRNQVRVWQERTD